MAKLSKESKETKQRLQTVFQAGQFVIRWGFIPTVLYLGFAQGGDPSMPEPHNPDPANHLLPPCVVMTVLGLEDRAQVRGGWAQLRSRGGWVVERATDLWVWLSGWNVRGPGIALCSALCCWPGRERQLVH
ncbi:hypothetical protein J4Q44_G00155760 [Coregonus suidteri]|uniref:Mitochondrial import receptor subunit TOM7 homolog n=1 Tax=Coregonus suidteri TaxID=861788 RepID=A0AAN8LMN4_9TELE